MPVEFPIEQFDRIAAEGAAVILKAVEAAAKSAGVACDTLHVKDQFAAAGIIETAKERGLRRSCDALCKPGAVQCPTRGATGTIESSGV